MEDPIRLHAGQQRGGFAGNGQVGAAGLRAVRETLGVMAADAGDATAALQQAPAEVGADESGGAGNQNGPG